MFNVNIHLLYRVLLLRETGGPEVDGEGGGGERRKGGGGEGLNAGQGATSKTMRYGPLE